MHNNGTTELLASGARTVETNSADVSNLQWRGVHVILDVTADPGSASVTLVIEGKDVISGKYYELLRGAAVASVGTTVYKVYPGITAAANASASDVLPRVWRVQVEVADDESLTYSVGANLIR